MLKRTAVLVLCCYLFSSTELSQFLKLIGHYLEHKNKQKDLSLWGFLCVHYFNGDVRDADYEKDMKLPFKTCTTQGHGETPVRLEVGRVIIPGDPGIELMHLKSFYYKFPETTIPRGGIWQPPKLCLSACAQSI
ncbi:hypothetical protein [Pedobacter jamesrossensis]|uniref:Uncharacterized protein n=1 Tax=Pedobacter jamesrossensis TaxID=1908238 RepID=A0ABV8NHW2_9SPHI